MDEFTRSIEATLFASATPLSIEEIAFRVGFAQRTLLRQLRRWTGNSPTQLRRTLTLATSVGSIASSVQPPL